MSSIKSEVSDHFKHIICLKLDIWFCRERFQVNILSIYFLSSKDEHIVFPTRVEDVGV